MLGRTYDHEVCSAARALELVGERWSLLILRNAMFTPYRRFTDFQARLGVAPNILQKRLELFVESGLMELAGDEYRLTPKGLDLKPVIIALTEWGDKWDAPHGPPMAYKHVDCGGRVDVRLECPKCGKEPRVSDVMAQPTKAFEAYRVERKR